MTRQGVPRHGLRFLKGNERLIGARPGGQTGDFPTYDRAQPYASTVARLNREQPFIDREDARQEVAIEPGRALPGIVERCSRIARNRRRQASIDLRRQRI